MTIDNSLPKALDRDIINHVFNVRESLLTEKNMSNGAFRVFMIISSLLVSQGCTCNSNKWIASHMPQEYRQIRRYLYELEKYGYIWIEKVQEKFVSSRKIWIPIAYIKYLYEQGNTDEKFSTHMEAVHRKREEQRILED